MAPKKDGIECSSLHGYCSPEEQITAPDSTFDSFFIEVYTFLDPFCPECWAFEPILKKLAAEYGHYIRIRYIISAQSLEQICSSFKHPKSVHKFAKKWEKVAIRTGMSCDVDVLYEKPISSPILVSLAIKAAELQGRQAGIKFFRKIRECLFLNKMNVFTEENLIECAKLVGLDIDEFQKDLRSKTVIKALKCDMRTSKEMRVEITPTFVFFNHNVEEEGIKISGIYPYEVYVDILSKLLGFSPEKREKMPLIQFLKTHQFVATKEIAVVYDLTMEEAEKQLKKLVLKQIVEKVPVKYGTFWRYREKNLPRP